LQLAATMKSVPVFVALATLVQVGCVTSSNRCVPGYTYDPKWDACLAPPDGGDDAGAAPDAGAAESDQDAAPVEGGEAGPVTASDLGASCNASSDCSGAANYCVKSPTAPTSPGYCSPTGCTAAECTSSYACCDCTSSAVAALKAFPAGVCVGTSEKATVLAFGCTCQ